MGRLLRQDGASLSVGAFWSSAVVASPWDATLWTHAQSPSVESSSNNTTGTDTLPFPLPAPPSLLPPTHHCLLPLSSFLLHFLLHPHLLYFPRTHRPPTHSLIHTTSNSQQQHNHQNHVHLAERQTPLSVVLCCQYSASLKHNNVLVVGRLQPNKQPRVCTVSELDLLARPLASTSSKEPLLVVISRKETLCAFARVMSVRLQTSKPSRHVHARGRVRQRDKHLKRN